MKFPPLIQQFVENELYKLCAGPVIQRHLGQYSSRSTWQPTDIIKRLIEACLEQTSLEDVCSASRGPSADRVHTRLASHELGHIERLVNDWLFEIASRQLFHLQTKITVAIDIHQEPFYGDHTLDWVTHMKRKSGTNYAISFLIVSIATGTKRCPVAVRLMTKALMTRKAQVIEDILSDLRGWLPITRALLDREFCTDAIVQLLDAQGLEYIMAAIRHHDVKTASKELEACLHLQATHAGVDVTDPRRLGAWARQHRLDAFRVQYVSTGKQLTPVELVAVLVRHRVHHRDPLKRWTYKWYLYLTNTSLSPREIVRQYGKRWIIETDIRCISDFQALTNSTKPQVRLLLYGLAMVFDALWVVVSILLNRSQSGTLDPITEETCFRVYQSDKILIIARAFKRYLRTEILPKLPFPEGDA